MCFVRVRYGNVLSAVRLHFPTHKPYHFGQYDGQLNENPIEVWPDDGSLCRLSDLTEEVRIYKLLSSAIQLTLPVFLVLKSTMSLQNPAIFVLADH